MAKKINTRHIKGRWAEHAAVVYLLLHGFVPLARNVRTPVGEIDILAKRLNQLHIIEVKWRKQKESVHTAISPAQKARLQKQISFVQRFAKGCEGIQFDAVFLSAKPPFIEFYPNIWAQE